MPIIQDTEEYLCNQGLDQMIAMLSVVFTPVKGRREMLREYCLPGHATSPSSDMPSWVVLDSDGEDNEEENVPLRQSDQMC